MKKIIYLLLTLPLLFTSCQNDEQAVSEETVQVSFTAGLPQQMGTRASSSLSVDKLYCAVFENGVEITALREKIDITDTQNIVFAPRLIRGRTYDITFWASKDGAYNVTNMKSISRNQGVAEENFDAFTACTSITVNGNASQTITLYRPLAQLKLGVTEEDWNGVANPATFNMTPTKIQLKLNAYTAFNALEGEAVGNNAEEITYMLDATGELFDVTIAQSNGTSTNKTFKSIGMCYVLMQGTLQNESSTSPIIFSIFDQSTPANAIRKDVMIPYVPLRSNYKTHLVGGLLTGTITYNIALSTGDYVTDDDHNKEIE